MKVFTTKHELKRHISSFKEEGKTLGFVPTMGALHQGHLSLIKKAKENNDIVVVSIFVNPTQFNNTEDLVNYPKTLEKDTQLLKTVSCDVLFHPPVSEMYDENVVSENFDFDGLEHQMEGKFREGHFNGVGTIVKTLFEIIKPNKAYFGQKDFQQLLIVKKMVEKHQLDVSVKGCAIYREEDGLAMSSRNVRLSKIERKAAPFIYKTLKKAKKKFKTEEANKVTFWVKKQFKKQLLLDLEYFTIADEETLEPIKIKETNKKYRAFIAVFAGDVRLIDNIKLKQL